MPGAILIVEDDPPLRMILERVLQQRGYQTHATDTAAAALQEIKHRSFDMLVTDLMMKPMDGLTLLDLARAEGFDAPAVFITANDDIQTALTAMRHGAFDYVVKPIKIPEFLETISRALLYRERKNEISECSMAPAGQSSTEFAATAPAMCRAVETARRLALTNVPLLILGEPGSGKTTFLRMIHELSHRRGGEFLLLDCLRERRAAVDQAIRGLPLPENPLSKGTLALDNLEGLAPHQQAALAEHMQGMGARSAVSPRLLAASSGALANRVADGAFSAPLYQRFSLLTITLPPLRERREDIPPLAILLARRAAGAPVAFEPAALAALSNYDWPANITEMERVIASAVQAAGKDAVRLEHLPPEVRQAAPRHGPAPAGEENLRGRSLAVFLKNRGVSVEVPPPAARAATPPKGDPKAKEK